MSNTTWELLYSDVKPRRVTYTRSIVSYLDILGFRELLETRTPGEISRILRILAESVKPSPLFASQKIAFTKFADTVIRRMPLAKHYPHNFIFELKNLLQAQIALIPQGIFVRGAVTVGDVVQSWKVVYGPGVVRAYELESQRGAPPRIVIDEKAIACLQPDIESKGLNSDLDRMTRKEGSTTYLDYLRACENELNVPEQEYPLFLAIHRDVIRKNLDKYGSKSSILAKYQWLRDYHERTLEDRFGARIPLSLRI